ncbi:MAG: SusC/RagA family TonB-linked outer membrane protein [Candidatus Pseudobacter hemicellulosilyticus]|uniref:SusC/RagA family TonB-linked outer membrane protein n=1 Tax=Candidatus Pseudobacter hemicellulosilyticus TaxID=3121375 RepID=A0AAJ5WV33_9BACT|nr:MAG: SusC/RagA family TonB-linked outer membrane protein [Pseudobacter sp.]
MRKSLPLLQGFFLLFLLFPFCLLGQTRQVSGRVTDQKGNPVSNATILVKGTNNGVSADDVGRFSITVSGPRVILLISAIGFSSKELNVDERTSYEVSLQPGSSLSEVVVTAAFGFKQRKKTLGYNVQEVTSGELTKGRENSFLNALQGKISGVNIVSSGGAPGAGTDIVIRGISSLNPGADNQPLVVIDGIPVNNSTNAANMVPSTGTNSLQAGSNDQFSYPNRGLDINPDDIESVSVLKGAGATALYGLRAANGVLIITTKKGSAGRMSINVNSSAAFDYLTKYPEIQTKYREGQQGRLSLNADGSLGSKFQTFGPLRTEEDPLYNNFKRAFTTGMRYNNSVSVQGGNAKTTYYSSFSALNQDGILESTSYDRYTFKLAGTTQLSDKFSVNASATLTTAQTVQPSAGDKGVMTALAYHTTTYDVRDYVYPDGSQKVYAPGTIDNPLYVARYSQMKSNLFRFVGNMGITYQILPQLKLDYKIGGDFFSDNRTRIVPGPRYPGDPTTLDMAISSGGFIVEERVTNRDINSNAFLSWDDRAGDFSYTLMVGNTIQVTYNDVINNRGEKFGLVGFYDLVNTINQFNSRTTTRRRYAGVFGSAKFGYKDGVYLEVTGRNDWSSTLPVQNNSFFYPAVSLSYNFTELHNLSNDVLNFGKFRISYAQVGKDAPPYSNGPYYVAPRGFPFVSGTTSILGFLRGATYADPDLKPEMQKSFEMGAELHFLQDRLNLDVSWYKNRNVDQIIPVPIAFTSGYSTYYTNAGTIENVGTEVELTGTPVRTDDWRLNLTVNWSQNRGTVKAIKEGITEIPVYDEGRLVNKLVLGGYSGDLYGTAYRRDENGNLLILPSGFPDFTPSFVKAGNAFPDWIGSVSATLTWKQFTLSGLLEYKKGGDMMDVTMRNAIRNGVLKITENRYQQIIFPGIKIADGKANDIPVVLDHNFYRNTNLFNNITDIIVQDASWLRLRNISLSYELPKAILQRTKFIRGASVGVTGSNFLLWTPFSGYDPGSNAFATGYNVYGFTGSNIPNFSSWIINLNVNF